jgi:hypothetical protein
LEEKAGERTETAGAAELAVAAADDDGAGAGDRTEGDKSGILGAGTRRRSSEKLTFLLARMLRLACAEDDSVSSWLTVTAASD